MRRRGKKKLLAEASNQVSIPSKIRSRISQLVPYLNRVAVDVEQPLSTTSPAMLKISAASVDE
jgi:hypothetical protein